MALVQTQTLRTLVRCAPEPLPITIKAMSELCITMNVFSHREIHPVISVYFVGPRTVAAVETTSMMLFIDPAPPKRKGAQVNKEKGHNRPDQTTASFLRPRRQEDGVAEDRADDHNQKCR